MDCARPGCIYLDTHVVPAPDTQTLQFSAILIALPHSAILSAPTQSTSPSFSFTPPKPPFYRYLAFCQILV